MKDRYYFRVSPFALGKVIMALEDDKEHVTDVGVSLEDDDLLVSFSKRRLSKQKVETSEVIMEKSADN